MCCAAVHDLDLVLCILRSYARSTFTSAVLSLRRSPRTQSHVCCAAMHDLDPVFRAWSRSPRVAALMRRLGFRRPLPVQSMYILKV